MANRDVEELRVELVAMRLIIRAMLAHMILNLNEPLVGALRELEDAVTKMSPENAPLPDVDPALQAQACTLAVKRTHALMQNIGAFATGPGEARRGPVIARSA